MNATVELVWGKPSRRMAQEVAGFWLLNGALMSQSEIRRRLGEVALVLRDPESAIVGVTTTYPYPAPGPEVYLGIRVFFDPAWRSLPLLLLLSDSAIGPLMERIAEPVNLIFYAENKKLRGKGVQRWLERRGWRRVSPEDSEKVEWAQVIRPKLA